MKKKTIVIRVICFIFVFCCLFESATAILRDKRVVGEYNPTTKIKGFYEEKKNSLDFVFVGSSQLYAHIAPAVLWEEYGMTSYDFAANEQPLWVSYYYIKEALKYQKPKAIVLEIFTVYGDDYEEEGVNHINLDDLPLSLNKLHAIHDSVPKELRYSYYFDIAKYHSTWSSLDEEKYKASFVKEPDIMKGYSPFVFVKEYAPFANEEIVNQNEVEPIPEKAMEWLYQIMELTKHEGVDLIFLKTPNGGAERQKLYNSVAELATKENIPFLNLNTVLDGEAHINILQAKKVTEAVGDYLLKRYEGQIEGREQRAESVRNSFDEASRYFNRYYKKCELLSADNFEDYLSFRKDEDYLVIFTKNYHEKSDTARVEVWDGGEAVFQKSVGKSTGGQIVEEMNLEDMQIVLTAGDSTEILIDGLDYSMHTDGYNMVVYDKVLEEFIEMASFDEGNDMKMERR